MRKPISKNLRNGRHSLYIEKELKEDMKRRAHGNQVSVNSWILQAIAEKMIREDRAQ